jgi:hypothetical protein
MANPNTYKALSADIDQVDLNVVFTVGASGAIGTVSRSKECNATTPVTHVSTGLYRVNLKEKWVALLNFVANCKQASYSTSGACLGDLKSDGDAVLSAGTATFEFRTIAGVLVDPASGDKVHLTLKLQKTAP